MEKLVQERVNKKNEILIKSWIRDEISLHKGKSIPPTGGLVPSTSLVPSKTLVPSGGQ